jgi:integrase
MEAVAETPVSVEEAVAPETLAADAEPVEVAANVIEVDAFGRSKGDPLAFTHGGRRYKLLKRNKSRHASYYIKFEFGKRQWFKSLETNSLLAAKARAKSYIEKVRSQKWEDVERLKARQTAATVGQVVGVYRPETEGAVGISGIADRSARNNVWAFGKILKMALNTDKPKEVSLNAVDKLLVVKFQDSMVRLYCERVATDDESQHAAREQALRSSRSIIHQARSLFNAQKEMIAKYEAAGLRIPKCVQEFMECKLQGKLRKREYLPPPDEIVQKAFVEIEKLREPDLPTYLAFWLAVGVGLRRKEILRAQKEHFIIRGGVPWYSGGIGKDGEKIEVPVQARAWAVLKDFVHDKQGKVLGEDATIEYARKINWWMSQQGWKTEKKLHELRAYVGSMIYVQNPVAAMKFLRHKSIRITEEFYARYGKVRTPDVL